jgi:putative effector of murein hydrolase
MPVRKMMQYTTVIGTTMDKSSRLGNILYSKYFQTSFTITAFTVERYVAICHPMKAQKMSSLHRAVRVIFSTWVIASLCAIPMTIQFGIVYTKDDFNVTILESARCTNKRKIV